jgi:membrane protein
MSAPDLDSVRRESGERVRRLWWAARQAVDLAIHGESVRLRAMALTYISLFALVPALVVAFSVIQAFTGMERIAELVNEFLLENLAVGARASLEPYLDKFVGNAHAASAGVVGGALLIWSMVSLLNNVDGAVNDVWGLPRRRSLRQRVVTYWLGLTLGPLLLAGSLYLGHAVRTWLSGSGLGVLPVAGGALLTCAFFSVIYLLVPETKVRIGAALGAGLVAGLMWELAKWLYAIAVTRFFRYNAIYGSVAVIPTFLLWLEVSWTILLVGARIAYVLQHVPGLRGASAQGPTTREGLAGRLLVEVGLSWDGVGAGHVGAEAGPGKPVDPSSLAALLAAPLALVTELIEALTEAGLVRAQADGGLLPGRSLERISLADVRRALAAAGDGAGPGRPAAAGGAHTTSELGPVDRALRDVEAETAARLTATTLRRLCDEERTRRERLQAGPAAASVPQGPTSV